MTLLQTSPSRSDVLAVVSDDVARQSNERVLAALEEPIADIPRSVGGKTVDDYFSFWGSLIGSFAVVYLLYFFILPFSGPLGFLVCWFLSFLALYAGVTAESNPRPIVVDRLMRAALGGGALIVFGALATTVVYVFVKGWPALHHVNFYTKDLRGVRPTDSLNRGGILHALVGSVIEVGIAVAIALPLGIGTAVYMSELDGRFTRLVRVVVESMTALPDIIAGLFIYVVFILHFGLQKSGFAAGLALTVMMLPIIARSADVVLRIVPGGLREASLALGASRWRTVVNVVLPTARSGLATALILGVARAVGETAPVLITSGPSSFFNDNPFDKEMNSLPLYIFTAVKSPESNFIARGYGAAAVLLAVVIVLFVATRILARDRKGSLR